MEERIGGIDVWDNHGFRIIYMGLDILQTYLQSLDICSYVGW